MTTATPDVDVNTAFAAERTQQILTAQNAAEAAREANAARAADFDQRVKDGKMQNLGNGKYKVTDPGSWDDGEVFTLQRVNGVSMLLPQHGLDETTGQVALYSRVPGWHGLGNVRPEGTTDIPTALTLGGLDWLVSKEPVTYTWLGETRTVADQFVTVRSDTGASLGVVGSTYHVVQNTEAFEFLQILVDDFGIPFESAGALRQGRSVFVSLRLPESVIIDVGGINDTIVPFVVALNSHDSSGKFRVVATPWRPLCANTERFAVRDAYTSWGTRHTPSATRKMEEARRTLKLSVAYYERFAAEETKLAQTSLGIDAFHDLIDTVWPVDEDKEHKTEKAAKAAATRRANLVESLDELFAENTATLGSTAYAAERTVTQFLDHHSMVKVGKTLREQIGSVTDARATYALEGVNDERKTRAHRKLLTLTNR